MDNFWRDSTNYPVKPYRLTTDDLWRVLEGWDAHLPAELLLVACGGTALTLLGYKESTRDVDFLLPFPHQYKMLADYLLNSGYRQSTGTGYLKPGELWLFDLFVGQRVFQTDLLDPVHEPEHHRVVRQLDRIAVATLTAPDLIISKMFRGDLVDVQDSIALLQAEAVDLEMLARRYRETASYYYHPEDCQKKLGYLVTELLKQGLAHEPLERMYREWKI